MASEADDEPLNISPFTKIFSHIQEGTVVLNPPETDQYSHVLSCLIRQFGREEDISSKLIEQSLQRAIFFALDVRKTRQYHSLEERMELALSELWNTLRRPANDFECYVAVKGVDLATLPSRFGLVTFLRFNENHLHRFKKKIEKVDLPKDHLAALSWQIKRSDMWGSSCARIIVKARDWQAAQMLAHQHVRMTIDSLNYFSDLLPYKMGWLHLPEESSVVSTLSIVVGENGEFGLPMQVKGPFPEFSFKILKEDRTWRSSIRRIDQMLIQNRPSDVEKLLLSSIQWAGRASVDSRREEAFLLFAIALESILLPKGDRELGHRLGLRTAHLLGTTASKRRDIIKEIGKLYGIRSNIVHNGRYQITDEERGRVRLMAKRVIFAILRDRSIARLRDKDELDEWLETRCLR